ncbi:hypothetical protein [Pseudohongiella spirulinae]|uniref:DUF4224 domain-containing protein n=1 Tax=Pseudohongiella spirulinae TaxID=1249552 RepID=A0A0S2KE64_9GAMM|nr:hypothetical protein [Pseudohongiella spirulinae]ALO46615.1 hypothetical protein PS2015_1973 [Pseudohongiella spirulinae]
MAESNIVYAEELARVTGLEKPAAIRRELEKQGIAVFMGKNGPWTTRDLIAAAGKRKMGLDQPANEEQYL